MSLTGLREDLVLSPAVVSPVSGWEPPAQAVQTKGAPFRSESHVEWPNLNQELWCSQPQEGFSTVWKVPVGGIQELSATSSELCTECGSEKERNYASGT